MNNTVAIKDGDAFMAHVVSDRACIRKGRTVPVIVNGGRLWVYCLAMCISLEPDDVRYIPGPVYTPVSFEENAA